MTIQCLNHYGVDFYFKNAECHDIYNYFQECVKLNKVFGYLKRTTPEHFATN